MQKTRKIILDVLEKHKKTHYKSLSRTNLFKYLSKNYPDYSSHMILYIKTEESKLNKIFKFNELLKYLFDYTSYNEIFKVQPLYLFKLEYYDFKTCLNMSDYKNDLYSNLNFIKNDFHKYNNLNTLLDYFKCNTIFDLKVLFKFYTKNHSIKCTKCDSYLKCNKYKEIYCINCSITCDICNKVFSNKKELKIHLFKEHNITDNSNKKIYCTGCKKELPYKYDAINIYPYKCKNKECIHRINTYKDIVRKTNISKKINFNEDTRKNYTRGALKREEKFKTTICDNGETLKYNISKRAGEKISKTIKEKISKGEWTPCVTNSWARSRCYVNGLPLRSSWEAAFYLLNPNVSFEKIRIIYINDKGVSRNYITDFQDFDKKIIYEIKPYALTFDSNNLLKEEAAKKWCIDNGWNFVYITEDYFKQNFNIIKDKIHLLEDEETIRKLTKFIKNIEKDIK